MWETFSGLILDQNRRNEDGLKELKIMLIKTTKKVMEDKECTCPIFRALEKKGLRWNPETEEIEEAKARLWRAKRGEKKEYKFHVFGTKKEIEEAKARRWRARFCEIYFIIDSDGLVCPSKEVYTKFDNMYWESGNYFRTEKDAQKYLDEFKRMLKERTLDKEE